MVQVDTLPLGLRSTLEGFDSAHWQSLPMRHLPVTRGPDRSETIQHDMLKGGEEGKLSRD